MGRSNSTDKQALGLKKIGSTTGFSAGDPIYETTSGTGKIPDAYVSSASFSATGDLVIPNSIANKNAGTYTLMGMGTATGTGPHYACALSNGNIATAYYQPIARSGSSEDLDVYLRVEQPNGTTAFADVNITNGSAAYKRGGDGPVNLSVTQLSGGKIVVVWNRDGGNGYPVWALLNATTGAIENGPFAEPTIQTYGQTHSIAALPNGNWVLVLGAGSSQSYNVYWRVFDNTGTAVSSWTTSSVTPSTGDEQQALSVVARADNTFVIAYPNAATGNGFRYHRVTADGTSFTTSTINGTSSSQCYGGQLVLTGNDEIVYVWQDSYYLRFSLMPNTSNTFDTTVDTANVQSGSGDFDYGYLSGNGGQIRAYCLSGTRKIYVFANFFRGPSVFMFYDADGVKLSDYLQDFTRGWNRKGLPGKFVETSDEIRFYTGAGTDEENNQRCPVGIHYKTFNKNYTMFGGSGISGALGTASGVATAAYRESGSTAKSATFAPTADGASQATQTQTTNAASLVVQKRDLFDATTDGFDLKARDGGGFFLLRQADANVYLHFYDKDYEFEKTVTVTTSAYNVNHSAGMCQLGNGRLVVIYGDTSTASNFQILNADGTSYQAETALNTSTQIYNGTSYCQPAVAPVIGDDFTDEFIVHYAQYSTRFSVINVFDETGNRLFAQPYIKDSGEMSYYSARKWIIPMPGGDFFAHGTYPAFGDTRIALFQRKPGATTNVYDVQGWSNRFNANYQAYTSNVCSSGRIGNPFIQGSNSAGTPEAYYPKYYDSLSSYMTMSATSAGYDRQNNHHFGVGGADAAAYMDLQYSSNGQIGISSRGPGRDNATDQNYNNVTDYSSHNAMSCQGSGNDIIWVRASTSGSNAQLYLDVVRPYNAYTNISYTAAASSSDPVDLASNRAAFIGVAVSDCPAGGTGEVQTKGTASLASTYKDASAESFDFVSRSTDGKSGSQSGRTVTIKES